MAAQVEFTVEAAVKELNHVSWPMLRIALDIEKKMESQIAEEYHGDPTASMTQLLKHWHNNHESSWENLAKALMSLPPFRRRGTYIYNKYVNPECFTAEKIADELSFIKDWFRLAHPFLDDSDRVRAAVEGTPVSERPLKVMKAWLAYYDVPSWDEVANIVEGCFPEHEAVAQQLRNKYLPDVEFIQQGGQKKPTPLEELTSQTAFTETSDISDWFALGWFLGLPEEELVGIESQHSRTDNRRQAVLDQWLEVEGKNASWTTLAKAIGKMRPHSGLSRKLLQRPQPDKKDTSESAEATVSADEEMESEETKEKSPENQDEAKRDQDQTFTAKVDDLKEYIGAIQLTVERLALSDTSQVQRIKSSLEDLKNRLEQLKIQQPTSMEQELGMSPGDILRTFSIISKTEGSFASNEDYTLDWKKYGCKLHIPRGSIDEGIKGKFQVYAIYSGPFQLPARMHLASAVYYISFSHDLLKPATLEVEHCSDIVKDEEGKDIVKFMYIPDTKSQLPYKFECLEDGVFDGHVVDNKKYGLIERRSFSIYGVGVYIVESIKSFLGYPSNPVGLGLLRFLTVKTVRAWKVEILLIKYLEAHKEHFRKEQKQNVIEEDFKKVSLEEDVITIGVSQEKEGSDITAWKGYSLNIVGPWEIISSMASEEPLQLCPKEIEANLPSKIHIDILCKHGSKPLRNKFRVHIQGVVKPYSFPVTIPQPHRSLSISSVCSESSSFNGDESEVLTDPPTLKLFIDKVATKVRCTSEEFAIQLLDEKSRVKFQQELRNIETHNLQFAELLKIWENSGSNITWKKVIEVLKSDTIRDIALAKKLERIYEEAFLEQ